MLTIIKSFLLFSLSAIFEIGGGYLIWLWVREEKSIYYGVIGSILLFQYGLTATLQTADFGRTYATYGGFFILFSIFWAYKFDQFIPDKYDIIGALVALIGVCIICYAPRG